MKITLDELEKISYDIRLVVSSISAKNNLSHFGSNMSIIEILTFLYACVLKFDSKNPKWIDRDYFVLSKGHAALSLYTTLGYFGFLNSHDVYEFGKNGSLFTGHASHLIPGVEHSTGSLGHGLSFAAGLAYVFKKTKKENKVFVVIGDGECDEGSIFEAMMFSSSKKLSNLWIIIDNNNFQCTNNISKINQSIPFFEKCDLLGFCSNEFNGHDFSSINNAFETAQKEPNKPKLMIAKTIKGKGFLSLENKIESHFFSPKQEELEYWIKNEKKVS